MNISENEIHIYNSFAADDPDVLSSFLTILSEEEINKANRYKFQKDKNNYISFRAMLRMILSQYLYIHPSKLNFFYAEKDKPYIKDTEIKFNISHSENFAVFAVTKVNEIGIDTEIIRELPDALEIAKNYFSEKEVKVFSKVDHDNYKEAFFNCWTRKEAFIKAIGEGLSYPLADFSVSFLPGENPEMQWIKGKEDEVKKWSLFNLDLERDYVTSLAIRSKTVKIERKEIYTSF
ncbi:MAG TPA: 4'-phosphopantetheinyl transferase superfamily protein [Ignavibacteria bacterium]|nr:4'-phosphopantetheinyl transferase superfamily protein [Ignavibacteria bacterium]